uniref:Uncharacterized protein n=1 Tax=Arundo donax TaxID=35708 RepID=A0A0A9DU13_ARUDO
MQVVTAASYSSIGLRRLLWFSLVSVCRPNATIKSGWREYIVPQLN